MNLWKGDGIIMPASEKNLSLLEILPFGTNQDNS